MDDVIAKNNAHPSSNAGEKHGSRTKALLDGDNTQKVSDQFGQMEVEAVNESVVTGTNIIGSVRERQGEHPYVPYTIQQSGGSDSIITVVFNIPSDM